MTFRRRERGSKTLVIAFARSSSRMGQSGFGAKFAQRLGYDYLYVSQRPGSYYQELSLEAFLAAVRPQLPQYAQVLAVGAGGGGHAALYYGAALGARVVAFNPVLPIHPRVARGEPSPREFHHADPESLSRRNGSVTVVYDPQRSRQRRFVRRVVRPAFSGAQFVELPHTGENSWRAIAPAEADEFLVQVIDEGVAPPLRVHEEV